MNIIVFFQTIITSQLSHEASADLTQLQITTAIKLLKANFIADQSKQDISNIITLANVIAINYQSIHLVKCTQFNI